MLAVGEASECDANDVDVSFVEPERRIGERDRLVVMDGRVRDHRRGAMQRRFLDVVGDQSTHTASRSEALGPPMTTATR